MTCIVGLEHDGKVYIGGDSAGVAGWSITERADEKVFRRGEWVFGFTSSFRMGQLLRYALEIPKPPERQIDKWMVTTFVDALRDTLKTGGFAEVQNGVDKGGTFLVGLRGRLYGIEDDFQVGRAALGFTAVGCGQEIARGALYVTPTERDPKRRVRRALEASAALNGGVAAPFHVVSA